MLEYERIDISLSFDRCHDLMQKATSFNNVAVVSAKRSDYRIHFCFMSKNDPINLLNSSCLSNKGAL